MIDSAWANQRPAGEIAVNSHVTESSAEWQWALTGVKVENLQKGSFLLAKHEVAKRTVMSFWKRNELNDLIRQSPSHW